MVTLHPWQGRFPYVIAAAYRIPCCISEISVTHVGIVLIICIAALTAIDSVRE